MQIIATRIVVTYQLALLGYHLLLADTVLMSHYYWHFVRFIFNIVRFISYSLIYI